MLRFIDIHVVTSVTHAYGYELFKHYVCSYAIYHTWRPIVFIQPGEQDMSIIICACKVSVDWY